MRLVFPRSKQQQITPLVQNARMRRPGEVKALLQKEKN
jgi:hypothetical protein